MDKKELKLYEAPTSEVMELRLEGMLCTSSDPSTNPFDDSTGDTEEI